MNNDYHALLTVHGLPQMTKRQVKNLISWLRKTADLFQKESKDLLIYSKRFRARLMK